MFKDNIWNDSVYFLCLTALISYGPNYHLAKTLFHCAGIMAFFSYIFSSLCQQQLKQYLSRINWHYFAIIVSVIIVCILTADSDSQVAIRFRNDILNATIPVLLIAPVLRPRKSQQWLILAAVIVACYSMALPGIIDYLSQSQASYRTSGSINLPIIYATNCALLGSSVFLITIQSILKNQFHIALISAIGVTLSLLAIIYSGSRGPLMALIAISVLVSIFYCIKTGEVKKFIALFMILPLLGFLIVSYSSIGPRIKNAYYNASEEGKEATSLGIRLQLWQAGLSELEQHPLTGTGIANHNVHFSERMAESPDFIHKSAKGFIHLHNDIINSLVWMGALAGTLFLIGIYSPTIISLTSARRHPQALIGFVAGTSFIISGLTNTPAMRAAALILYFMVIFMVISGTNEKDQNENKSR